MKKAKVLKLLGGPSGDRKLVAQRLGIAEKSITNWRTDAWGNLTERRVLDAVLATLMRERIALMATGQVSPDDPAPVTMDDLMELCALPMAGRSEPEGESEVAEEQVT